MTISGSKFHYCKCILNGKNQQIVTPAIASLQASPLLLKHYHFKYIFYLLFLTQHTTVKTVTELEQMYVNCELQNASLFADENLISALYIYVLCFANHSFGGREKCCQQLVSVQ